LDTNLYHVFQVVSAHYTAEKNNLFNGMHGASNSQ